MLNVDHEYFIEPYSSDIQKVPYTIYLGTFTILAFYLISVIFQWEFFFFFSLFIVIVLITALIKFEAALLFIPITLANPYVLEETGTKLNIAELVLLIIFVVWLCRILLLKERIVFPKKFLVTFLIIIATAILSLLVARDLEVGIKQIVRYIEILLLFFMLIITNFKSEKKIRQVFLFLIIGGLITSFVGISEFINNALELKQSTRVYGWGSGYAAYVATTLIFAVCALEFKEQKALRTLALFTIPVAGLALLVSQTRTWMYALIVVFGILFLWRKPKVAGKIILVLGFVVGFIALLMATNFFGLIESDYFQGAVAGALRFGETKSDHSLKDASLFLRLGAWGKAVMLYINNPILGIGVGNFRIDYFTLKLAKAGDKIGYVDSQYIQGFTEAGTIAGIAWIVFVFQAVRLSIKSVRLSVNSNLYVLALGFFGSLLLLVVGSFFWVITPVHDLFCLMILDVGLLYNIVELTKLQKPSEF
ncbi:MAG: O-antigen ligase family protein [Bacteroidota bacterium]